jgi:hypothetical protein
MTEPKQEPASRLHQEKKIYRVEALEYQTTRFLGRAVNFRTCCRAATISSYVGFLVVAAIALTLKYQPRVEGDLSKSPDGARYVVRAVSGEELSHLRAGDVVYLQFPDKALPLRLPVDAVNPKERLIESHVRDATHLPGGGGTTAPVAVLFPKRPLFFR